MKEGFISSFFIQISKKLLYLSLKTDNLHLVNHIEGVRLNIPTQRLLVCASSVLFLTACGGGSGDSTTASTTSTNPGLLTNSAIPPWANAAVQAVFNDISSQQNPNDLVAGKYSVDALVAAFANNNFFDPTLTTTQQVYNITAFLANSGHETGSGYPPSPSVTTKTGWQYLTELNTGGAWSTDGQGTLIKGSIADCQNNYIDKLQPYNAQSCYYGRGSMQLSWNYNYTVYDANSGSNIAKGVFNDPDMIVRSTTALPSGLLWDSGAWFWSSLSQKLTPGSSRPGAYFGLDDPSKYNTSDPMGKAINVVNGKLECNPGNVYAMDRIYRFIAWLPLVAQAAGVPITTYNTLDTVGVSCVGPNLPPAPKSQGLTVNFNNTSASDIAVTLGNPFYDYPATKAGQTVSYNQLTSGNLANQFPTTTPVAVSVYLNRDSAPNPPVACSGSMAATGVSYTITIPNATSCSISGPTSVSTPVPIKLQP